MPVQATSTGLAPTTSQSPYSDGLKSLGKDDFLQLLVTKMQNQDPLNPQSDEDFIAQLAQFSSLEQMTNIADGIAEANQWDFLQMQSINNVMASSLIGKDVKAHYSGVYIDQNGTADVSFTTSQYAEDINIRILDQNGELVAEISESDVAPGAHTVTWDGRDTLGNHMDEGFYSVEAVATNANGDQFQPNLSLVGRVEAVTYRDGVAFFSVNGIEIPFGDVSSIGEPGSFQED